MKPRMFTKNVLIHSFELFRMKPSETIGDMFTRFTDVVNGLKGLGKSFSDFELCNLVENGFSKSSLPMIDWNDLEKKAFTLNAKAMNALFCALDKNEFNRVSICETAFDIWHTLEVTHEGTSRVKESKINLLIYSFQLF